MQSIQSNNFSLQSAVSPDGKLVAVVVPSSSSSNRLRIQIYRASSSSSSCSLQLTLTYNKPSKDENCLNQLVFASSSSLVGLVGDNLILIWDLTRGVVAEIISCQEDEDQRFVDIAVVSGDYSRKENADGNGYLLYALVATTNPQKLYVREYSGTKLLRKVKSGRWGSGQDGADESSGDVASLAVSEKHLIVRTFQAIRVMNRETGQKVGKLNAPLSRLLRSSMIICPSDPNILVATKDDSGTTIIYTIKTCKPIAEIPRHEEGSALSTSLTRLQLVKHPREETSSYKLLSDQLLYNVEVGSSTDSCDLISQISYSNAPSTLVLAGSDLVALQYQKSGECVSEWFSLDSDDGLPDQIQLGKTKSTKESPSEPNTTSKRKAANLTSVLGPGQAGSESLSVGTSDAIPPSKRSKADASDDDADATAKHMSISERLKQFSQAMEEDDDENDDYFLSGDKTTVTPKTSFVPKKATTESLKEFLTQALQSGDKALLELALSVRDSKVITQTLNEIDPSLKIVLLHKLTTRLASKPSRAESLVPWLSLCLKSSNRDSANAIQVHHLSALRNLLSERTESFLDLLRLEGRLSMLCD